MTLWQGRFGGGPADELMAFTVSLPFDRRLAADDLVGSRAHVRGLQRAELLTPDEASILLAALDRVAKTQEPEELSLFCSTTAWWLLRRLRGLGFRVYWPSWIMCSVPLPGLDRYVPTRPPTLL